MTARTPISPSSPARAAADELRDDTAQLYERWTAKQPWPLVQRPDIPAGATRSIAHELTDLLAAATDDADRLAMLDALGAVVTAFAALPDQRIAAMKPTRRWTPSHIRALVLTVYRDITAAVLTHDHDALESAVYDLQLMLDPVRPAQRAR